MSRPLRIEFPGALYHEERHGVSADIRTQALRFDTNYGHGGSADIRTHALRFGTNDAPTL